MDNLCTKYQSNRQSNINIIELYGNFSRGIAIDTAIHSKHIKNTDIIFLIDVDIYFKKISLERIRLNTIRNQQIYLPIVFSEYDPAIVNGIDAFSYNSSFSNLSLSSTTSSSTFGLFSDYLLDYKIMHSNYMLHENFKVNNDAGYFREFGE